MTQASGTPDVPDLGRRQFMNLLLLGAGATTVGGMLYPVIRYFVPPSSGGAGGGTIAKDEIGNNVVASSFLDSHGPNARELVQGLKGDPTYLVVTESGSLAGYAINSVCTHLGCVVPWNASENKFICPCHGSQYNAQGKVVRGPAPLSLALAHTDVTETGEVSLTPWTETDFRTGEKPWWA